MKKLSLIFITAFAIPAMAAEIGPAGCGLGNMVWGGKDNQVLASTTNASSYTNMFGITSGTSNCVDGKGVAKLETFIEGNKQAFATESARGNGETLTSVAQILNCQNQGKMNKAIRANHSRIFSSESTTEISQNLRSVLAKEQVSCGTAG